MKSFWVVTPWFPLWGNWKPLWSGYRPSGSPRLADLVRAVGRVHLLGPHAVQLGDRRAKGRRLSVGIPVECDLVDLGAQRLDESLGWWLGRLVGVQSHLDVDLW